MPPKLAIFKALKSHFEALFKEKLSFSRQIEKSSTFRDSIQIQALFKACGNHVNALQEFRMTPAGCSPDHIGMIQLFE